MHHVIIFHQSNICHSASCNISESDDVFTATRAGQSVIHLRSTNSKPQPSNQFSTGTIHATHRDLLLTGYAHVQTQFFFSCYNFPLKILTTIWIFVRSASWKRI